MPPRWSDEMTLRFIELYKAQRCLWDQQLDLYKDRDAREKAYASIAHSINVQGFGITEVKAKIKSLRGTFNIEMAKLKKSVESGSPTMYVPILRWFNAMKEVMVEGTLPRQNKGTMETLSTAVDENFVETVLGNDSISTGEEEGPAEEPLQEELIEDLLTEEFLTEEQRYLTEKPHTEDPLALEPAPPSHAPTHPEKRRKIENASSSDSDKPHQRQYQTPSISANDKLRQFETIPQFQQSIAKQQKPTIGDEIDVFGQYVAAQLRELPLKNRLMLQDRIQTILTRERLVLLHSTTVNSFPN